MRFAYADPPYLGQGRHYDHPDAGVWDKIDAHAGLVEALSEQFPDGWALSCSSPSLRELLPFCPTDVRIAAWVKPFAVFKPNVNPAYAWEPVIFRGGRKGDRERATVRDWLSAVITLKKGLVGAKPPAFNDWILDLLGWEPGDQIVDLFPGTNSLAAAVDRRLQQLPFDEIVAPQMVAGESL